MGSQRRTNARLLVCMATLLLAFGLVVARAVVVQVGHAAEYSARAESQHVRKRSIDAPRGVIYDRDRRVLVISQRAYTVSADLATVQDRSLTAAKLADVLGTEVQQVESKLEGERGWSTVAWGLDKDVADRVTALKLPGIVLDPEQKRVYPKGTLAGQVLGWAGRSAGVAGLELQYDKILTGTEGELAYVRAPDGRRLALLGERNERPGGSLVLTLDQDIQFETESVLVRYLRQYEANRATAIVLDQATGDVLAMANVPRIDANQYNTASLDRQRNMAVTDVYEPGSTFKMVTVAAALEAGRVTPETTFSLPRTLKLGGIRIGDHEEDLPAVRDWTVTQILAQSSNIGAVKIGQAVGEDRLMDMIRRFGFGMRSGIDFPGEEKGLLPGTWRSSTMANVPMGQGIAVTPLQIAAAYATVANDGVAMQPHLVRRATPSAGQRVISEAIARQLRTMLTSTVEEGTGKAASVRGYKVAGKTGTAQKVVEGAYSKKEYVSSFVGMVPADHPRVVVLVVVDHPKTKHLGGTVAAPAFRDIADFVMKHLKVPPSEDLGLTPPVAVPKPVARPGE